ncbi:hypothetical protein ABPG74_008844 [Tetrahymena malaccensis]
MSFTVARDDNKDKRGQNQTEVIEQRLKKLYQDISILQSRTGIKKQQVSQKNLDQLMSLLNKKIQQYSFPDTTIGQNHYKLVQKGMDAPSLERKLQEQRFLAEKELSSKSNLEKSLFWMDIVFSKEGIDTYLENNQNYLMFNSVDTMRSRNSKEETFATRLLAKKSQLRGILGDTYRGNVAALASAPGFKYDQFHRFEQESSQNIDDYIKAMSQFQQGNFTKYCDYLAKKSIDYKEVWQLLEKMVPTDGSNIFKISTRLQRLRKAGQQNQNYLQCLQNNFNLQNAYHNGIQYLQQIYRKNAKQKKQNFQRIYDVYNVDQIRGFDDDNIPVWQEIYQLFRAGDYDGIFNRCQYYSNVSEIQEFQKDLDIWLKSGQRKNNQLSQKIRPNWDAFRYQIYLIMIKDPSCVDDVFIEDLDDCLWMNLKCSEVYVPPNQQDPVNPMNIEDDFDDQYEVLNGNNVSTNLINQSVLEDEKDNFYDTVLKASLDISQDDILPGEDVYSWIDWNQLQDLRKMLYESFKESPDVFNPSRVLMIQLLTLDFIGFVQTLLQLEKSAISQHEFIHFLILILKTGLVRASVECSVKFSESGTSSYAESKDILVRRCKEFEESAEKKIILYAKDRFDNYPDTCFSYIESLPIKVEDQLKKYANIYVGSKQNFIYLFKPNLNYSQQLESNSITSTSSQTQNRGKVFDQICKINNRLKKITYTTKASLRTVQNTQSENLLTLLAKIVAQTYIQTQNKVEVALDILDNVGAFEDIGRILKEQYRLCTSLTQNHALKTKLKDHTDNYKLLETLEKYTEKYFGLGKKFKKVYREEKKQYIDCHVIYFYKLFYKIKVQYQNQDYNISAILLEMQEAEYISSNKKKSAASEFFAYFQPDERQSYFDFLYLVYLCTKRFMDQHKNPSFYNQAHKLQKPEDFERAKPIFSSIIKYCNDFVEKNIKSVDSQFEKTLLEAKHNAQVTDQV